MKRFFLLLCSIIIPLNLYAFKVTIYDLSEEDSYFNAEEVKENKGITLRWTSSVTNATFYINVDSSTKNPDHQIASGDYNGGDASYTIYASEILSHANNSNDGDKEIYVLIEAQESEDGGSSSLKFQENIKSIVVHFDRVPPPRPSINSVVPGERSLNVYLNWGTNSSESDKYGFNIYWRKSGSNDEPFVSKNVKSTSYRITGLTNNIAYEIWAEQIDRAGNVSEKSDVTTATPVEVLDYYEYYRKSGGKEEGGFCFIATATYGSPVHPIVYIFKAFRDTYLVKLPFGDRIISLYYRFSPIAADYIRNNPLAKVISLFILTPLALFIYILLKPVIIFFLFTLILLLLLLRRRFAGLIVIFILLCPLTLKAESDRSFGLSVNIGDFRPSRIDNEKGLTAKPYKEIFDNKSELMFKVGFDYEPIQRFGTLSIGGAIGFWQVVGKGVYNLQSDVVERSRDTTVFNIIPLELNLIYRFDQFVNSANIPFAPYIKGGLDYYNYWITDSKGDISSYEGADGKRSDAYGGKYGYHYSAGLMFLLDWIDRETSMDFDMEFGVNNSFIFIEYFNSSINNFGREGFDLSSRGIFFGLYLDI